MTRVDIAEETLAKVRVFSRVIDAILEEKLETESDYFELILSVGMERMLQDPLPNEEGLRETIVSMFNRNPGLVTEYIAERLRQGAEIEASKTRKSWEAYVA